MRSLLSRALAYLPFVLLAAATGLLATYSQTHSDGLEDVQLYIGTFSWRLQNALVSLGLQLKHLAWPVDLTYYYRPNRDGAPFNALYGYLSLATATALVWWLYKSLPALRRALVCCGLFFLFSIGPTLGIAASFGRQAYADRFTYVPMMAFSILGVLACAAFAGKGTRRARLVLAAALLAAVAAFATEAWRYTRTFRSERTVSTRVLEFDDLNADALRVIGGAHLIEDDDPSLAIDYFRQAVAIDPQHQAVLDLIFALRKRARPDDLAEFAAMTEQFRRDPSIDEHGLVIDMLAEDALKSGDHAEARRYFQAMTKVLNPVFAAKAKSWLATHPK